MADATVARGEAAAASSAPSDASRAPPARPATARKQQVRDALTMLFGYRLLNALCVRTFFQPDEYFQVLEPAWKIAFGQDSGAWMTWEWQHKLRSSLHPGLFSLGYFIVANYMRSMPFGDSYTALALVIIPKVMQAGIAALSDWYAWRLGEKLYGRNSATAWSVLLMNMTNPWHWYISTRTFSNTFEAALTIAALYYWPWELFGLESKEKEKSSTPVLETSRSINSLRLSIVLASIAVLLRPTNVLIWAILGIVLVTRFAVEGESPLNFRTTMILVRESLLCGTLVLALSLLADHGFYGEWTFPPYSFLHYNLAQALAIFYGQNDGHYYLSQGIPLSFTTTAPFVVVGLLKAASEPAPGPVTTKNAVKAMGFAAAGMISALSLISHKEVRFIYPLVPMLSILAAPHITSFFTEIREGGIPTSSGPIGVKRRGLLGVGLLVNITVAAYLSWFHAAAPIQVMGYLRGEFERIHGQNLTLAQPLGTWNASSEPLELFALFLTPCHATPWRSHLIYPALRARELTCEPPLHTEPGSAERAAYIDESWRFERDKVGFMSTELWPEEGAGEQIPRYIIGFQGIEDALREYFGSSGPGANKGVRLTQTWKGWNGLFTDDDRKAGELRVWDTNHYADGAAA